MKCPSCQKEVPAGAKKCEACQAEIPAAGKEATFTASKPGDKKNKQKPAQQPKPAAPANKTRELFHDDPFFA